MRRLVLEKLCGICWSKDRFEAPAVFAETVTVGDVTRDLDLCAEHAPNITVLALRETLLRYGTKIEPITENGHKPRRTYKRKTDDPLTVISRAEAQILDEAETCRVCGRTFKTRQARGSHEWNAHQIEGVHRVDRSHRKLPR